MKPRLIPSPARALSAALFMGLLLLGACAESTAPDDGLVAGTYRVIFEVGASTLTADELEGRHEITFSVAAPAVAPADVELVSARLILEDGSIQNDHVTLDRSLISMAEGRWQMRFPYATGGFNVSWTMVELESGTIIISPGCFVGVTGGASSQAAGCRLDIL